MDGVSQWAVSPLLTIETPHAILNHTPSYAPFLWAVLIIISLACAKYSLSWQSRYCLNICVLTISQETPDAQSFAGRKKKEHCQFRCLAQRSVKNVGVMG